MITLDRIRLIVDPPIPMHDLNPAELAPLWTGTPPTALMIASISLGFLLFLALFLKALHHLGQNSYRREALKLLRQGYEDPNVHFARRAHEVLLRLRLTAYGEEALCWSESRTLLWVKESLSTSPDAESLMRILLESAFRKAPVEGLMRRRMFEFSLELVRRHRAPGLTLTPASEP